MTFLIRGRRCRFVGNAVFKPMENSSACPNILAKMLSEVYNTELITFPTRCRCSDLPDTGKTQAVQAVRWPASAHSLRWIMTAVEKETGH